MKAISLIFGLLSLLLSHPILGQGDILTVAQSSKEHSTLIALLKAADLTNTLKGDGPFTLFAPTDESFDQLPQGTLEKLLKPTTKNKLTSILTYHVISGDFSAADIIAGIKKEGGNFTIKTIAGGTIVAKIEEGNIVLEDSLGTIAIISKMDLQASNGVIHIINSVLRPQ